jgi:hypothetical protein
MSLNAALITRSPSDILVAASYSIHERPTLLTGRMRATQLPDATARLFLLAIDEVEADVIASTDHIHRAPSDIAKAAVILTKAGLRLDQVAQALGLDCGRSSIHRIVDAARTLSDRAMEKLDAGTITWGHVHLLAQHPAHTQDEWLGRILARGVSVRQLEREMKNKAASQKDADTQRYERDLQAALGAPLTVTGNGARYRLAIQWDSIGVLIGVLEKLGQAPTPKDPPHDTHPRLRKAQGRKRDSSRHLVFDLIGTDEMEALTGHLTGNEW